MDQNGPALVHEFHRLVFTLHTEGDHVRHGQVALACSADVAAPTSADTADAKMDEPETSDDKKKKKVKQVGAGEVAEGGKAMPSEVQSEDILDTTLFQQSGDGVEAPMEAIQGPVALPALTPQATHKVCVYVCSRARLSHSITVTATVTYDNEEGAHLTYVASFQVQVELPVKVHILNPLNPPVPKPNHPNRIIQIY